MKGPMDWLTYIQIGRIRHPDDIGTTHPELIEEKWDSQWCTHNYDFFRFNITAIPWLEWNINGTHTHTHTQTSGRTPKHRGKTEENGEDKQHAFSIYERHHSIMAYNRWCLYGISGRCILYMYTIYMYILHLTHLFSSCNDAVRISPMNRSRRLGRCKKAWIRHTTRIAGHLRAMRKRISRWRCFCNFKYTGSAAVAAAQCCNFIIVLWPSTLNGGRCAWCGPCECVRMCEWL